MYSNYQRTKKHITCLPYPFVYILFSRFYLQVGLLLCTGMIAAGFAVSVWQACMIACVWQACMIAHVTLHNFIIEVLLAPTLVIHCSPDWYSIVCRHVCCMWCSLMVTCVCLAVSMQLVLVLYIADSPPTCSGMAQVGFEYCTLRNPWTVFCVTPFRLND